MWCGGVELLSKILQDSVFYLLQELYKTQLLIEHTGVELVAEDYSGRAGGERGEEREREDCGQERVHVDA